MMNMKLSLTILLSLLVGCATQIPRPRLESSDYDLFRHESLTQYSLKNLELLTNKKQFKAIALCQSGKINDGLSSLKKDFNQQKNNSQYWLHVGNCYLLGMDEDKAKFYYNISLETAGKNEMLKAFAYNNLGILYLRNNHIVEAKEYFEKAYNGNKELIIPRYNLGQIYIRFGILDEALRMLLPLEGKEPKAIDLLSSIATIYALQDNPKLALSYFGKINDASKKREDIACAYALALYLSKDYDKAKIVLSSRESLGMKELQNMASKLEDEIDNELDKIKAMNEQNSKKKK